LQCSAKKDCGFGLEVTKIEKGRRLAPPSPC
jgi:hypothetical protein